MGEGAAVGGGRVALVDPNSHTLPYDQALAAALARAGREVELVVSPFLHDAVPPAVGYRLAPRFFRPTAGRLGAVLAQRPRARRLLKAVSYPLDWLALLAHWRAAPPPIVHIQWSLRPEFDLRLWRWLQRRGQAVVYTAHNLLPHAPVPGDEERYGRLYAAADALIVHTEATARALAARFGVPAERLFVAPHGPLLEEEPALPRAAARRRLGLPPGVPVVLFAGLIEPYKGLDDLVAAFIALAPRQPTAWLVVAGRPNTPLAPARRRLAAAGLQARTRFDERFLPRAELAAYLCAADVVVLPYRAATSSGLLMAARRFACPVVATRVGDLAAVIEDGVSGLLAPPGDPAALARAVERLVADAPLAARLGAAGRRAALTTDSWDAAAARTLVAHDAARRRLRQA